LSKKIGIYGGTFDPIHWGHINLALEAKERRGLDEVWWIPVYVSPFKEKTPPKAHFEARLEMCRMALEEIKSFKVLEIEAKNPNLSYTIDTIRFLQMENPEDKFYLILGDEQAKTFHLWKEVEEIVRRVELIVGRRGANSPSDVQGSKELLEALKRGSIVTRILEISSTDVRDRIKKRLYISHLVPSKVVDYISKNLLYS
jgi:nicotinate-nucleotide adenylyltransferase